MPNDRWYHAELTNWLPSSGRGDIACFDDRLLIQPDWEAPVKPESTTADLRLSADLPIAIQSDDLPCLVVPAVCDLLSFASRRAVSFVSTEAWADREYVSRGANWCRGPVESVPEVKLLLDRALPMLLDPHVANTPKLGTALKWFLSSRMQHNIEMCYVVLWMVLEMTARAYAEDVPSASADTVNKIKWYLNELNLPALDTDWVGRLYGARSNIVHGFVDDAPRGIWKSFGSQVEEREEKLQELRALLEQLSPAGDKAEAAPQTEAYNRALNEACMFLSRVLEKMFLARWSCTEFSFYQRAEYFSVWAW